MGHDISGFNKAGEEIAYARFSMGNYNSTILYSLLDANHFFAGVSGSGDFATYSIQQIERALKDYNQLYGNYPMSWDLKQIQEFILNCLVTSEKEGSVRVYFG